MPEWKYKARALHQQCANFHHNPTCGSLISNRLCSIGDWLPWRLQSAWKLLSRVPNGGPFFVVKNFQAWLILRSPKGDWTTNPGKSLEIQAFDPNCRSWGFSLLDCRGIEAFKRDGFRQAERTNFQQACHHRSRNKTIRWKSLIPHHFPQRGEGLMRERILEITKKRNIAAQAELAASCSLQPL